MKAALVNRLVLRNYKSVATCDISLEPLTILVGRNAAGKSNILDALRFTTDALQNPLEFAMRERGGINEVRRRSLGSRPPNFSVEMQLSLPHASCTYAFRIAAVAGRKFSVDEERCEIRLNGIRHAFRVERGEVSELTSGSPHPPLSDDRLALPILAGIAEFKPLFTALTRMTFHNLNPESMKRPQKPEPGDRLARDGHNLASVIKQVQAESPNTIKRVIEYLQSIGVPIDVIAHKQVGSFETLEISQLVQADGKPKHWKFDASALSDGTMRTLGILMSLLSASANGGSGPTLVGIEEPETALHPAAAGALVDALLEACAATQIVLTCHSPDLLDRPSIRPEFIRVVLNEMGITKVGPLSPAKKDLLQQHLSTAGELLRLDQLTPDPEDLKRQEERKGTLFEAVP